MSKQAEERALEAYPPKRKEVSMSGCVYTVVGGDFERRIYQQGYEHAEKDLALTVEDIKTILDISFWNNDPEKILQEYNRLKK